MCLLCQVNPEVVPELEKHGLHFVGQDETQERMEIMELAGGREGGVLGGKEGDGREGGREGGRGWEVGRRVGRWEGVRGGESLRWEGEDG